MSRKSGKFVKEINNTIIVLVTKKNDSKTMNDFCPISLCNIIFPKHYPPRLNKILGKLISKEQNRFTPGREIANKIILAS